MTPDKQGRLWSEQLQCWLVAEGPYLRLYNHKYQQCLTEAQAEALLRKQATEQAEEQARRAEAFAAKLRSLGINPDEVI